MKYIIEEEELYKLIPKLIKDNNIQKAWDNIRDFLKPKTPVEEIDDEEVRRAINWNKDLGEEKYKIYIEVITPNKNRK